jgi:hypothetical protein
VLTLRRIGGGENGGVPVTSRILGHGGGTLWALRAPYGFLPP